MRNPLMWIGWTIMALVSLYVAFPSAAYLLAPVSELRLKPSPPSEEWALRLHAAGGLIALALGPLQFVGMIRKVAPLVHRAVGYIYILAVAAGVIGAAVLAQTPNGGGANVFAFGMLAILWAISTAMALVNARLKRWRDHRTWMVRSFALTFAAVTLRLGMPLLGAAGFGSGDLYAIVAWASWTINLIVAEWLVLPWLSQRDPVDGDTMQRVVPTAAEAASARVEPIPAQAAAGEEIPLDGLRMRTTWASSAGVVDPETVLVFEQAGRTFSARYRGGAIFDGLLVGRVLNAGNVEFRYVQADQSGRIDQGFSTGVISRVSSGRVRLVETFQWITRPGGGVNVFEEIPGR
jgi:uncharacterized membrane protein